MKTYREGPVFERIVYVFQGGGALGAYQAGVFQALQEGGYAPDWVIGNSIGGINASIIAGNLPHDRVDKLKKFWEIVSKPVWPGIKPHSHTMRKWYNYFSAQQSIWWGQTGFFYPRLNSPLSVFNNSLDTLSFYVTDPLKTTLENLINFDILNSANIHLSLGVVEVQTGNSAYFENTTHHLNYKHILASAALPPGFPAIEIDGQFYWDHGILSNAPLERLISECQETNTLCFIVNLFNSHGLNPTDLDGVLKRYKDITYSGQYIHLIKSYREAHRLRRAIRQLCEKLPDDTQAQNISRNIGVSSIIHFVHFLYRAGEDELSSMDYDFSKLSLETRFMTGYRDGSRAVKQAPWYERLDSDENIILHDIWCYQTK